LPLPELLNNFCVIDESHASLVSILVGGAKQGYREGTGKEAVFDGPSAIAYHFDTSANAGRLLVADQTNGRFRAIDLKSGALFPCDFGTTKDMNAASVCCAGTTSLIAGSGVVGHESGAASQSQFEEIRCIRPDPSDDKSLICCDRFSVRRIKGGKSRLPLASCCSVSYVRFCSWCL
jgi:hypothetical protein